MVPWLLAVLQDSSCLAAKPWECCPGSHHSIFFLFIVPANSHLQGSFRYWVCVEQLVSSPFFWESSVLLGPQPPAVQPSSSEEYRSQWETHAVLFIQPKFPPASVLSLDEDRMRTEGENVPLHTLPKDSHLQSTFVKLALFLDFSSPLHRDYATIPWCSGFLW